MVDGQDKSVLARAAAILGAFKVAPPVLSLSELSSRSRLPKSTVHRLAEQLLVLGWLERVTGGYRVGIRLFEVGELAERCNRMRDSALPYLRKLATTTMWAIHLAVLDRNEVVYLDKIPAKEVDIPSRTGGRMPAYCTGLGKAMLAYEGNEGIERAIAAGLDRRTSNTLALPHRFPASTSRLIRKTGVAYDPRGIMSRHRLCRGPDPQLPGRAIGAVSVTGFSRRSRFQEDGSGGPADGDEHLARPLYPRSAIELNRTERQGRPPAFRWMGSGSSNPGETGGLSLRSGR